LDVTANAWYDSASEPFVPPIACIGPLLGRPPMAMVFTPAWRVIYSTKIEHAEAQIPSVMITTFPIGKGWEASGVPPSPEGIKLSAVSS
jgi:hypothetical protein